MNRLWDQQQNIIQEKRVPLSAMFYLHKTHKTTGEAYLNIEMKAQYVFFVRLDYTG